MSTSEHITELASALAQAQAEMPNAILDAINPHYKSKYASLASMRAAALPSLSKFGLSVVQTTEIVQAGLLLRTILMHSSGQWLDATYPIDADFSKPQTIGAAISYGRRHCYSGITGLASEEGDDDGEGAREAAGKSGNGGQRPLYGGTTPSVDDKGPRLIYERLVNTMRSSKSADALAEWKARTQEEVNTLSPEWYDRLITVYHETKAKLPKSTKPLSEQAVEADKPLMPDDEIPI